MTHWTNRFSSFRYLPFWQQSIAIIFALSIPTLFVFYIHLFPHWQRYQQMHNTLDKQTDLIIPSEVKQLLLFQERIIKKQIDLMTQPSTVLFNQNIANLLIQTHCHLISFQSLSEEDKTQAWQLQLQANYWQLEQFLMQFTINMPFITIKSIEITQHEQTSLLLMTLNFIVTGNVI